MIVFDPAKESAELRSERSSAKIYLALDFEWAKSVKGLGSAAHGFFSGAVQCYLCGVDELGRPLLEKARDWVQVAIDIDEQPERDDQDFTKAFRYETLALCNWLLTSKHDDDSYRSLISYADRYLTRIRRKTEIGMMLLNYVDAGSYDKCIKLAENAGIKAPKTLRAVRAEAQMCLVSSLGATEDRYSALEVSAGHQVFLSNNLDEWLGRGYFPRAAQWLKIIYWNSDPAGRSPQEALLKAYEHLPGRIPPKT